MDVHSLENLSFSSSFPPHMLFFSRYPGAGGWSPLSSDRYQWLEVDLGERTQISAVATQGRYGSSDWLIAYLLMFSDTGHNWKQYHQEDGIGVFPGNSNADSVVKHKLQQPVIARYVRLIPLDWNPNGRIGLRLETYGCPYDSDVVSFSGHSSLVYRLSPRPRISKESISLNFKTLRNSGILFHAEGQNQQSITLELEKGKLLLLLQKGRSSSPDSRHLVSLGSLLDDQHWHYFSAATQLRKLIHIHALSCFSSFSIIIFSPLHSPLLRLSQGNVTFSCAEPVSVAMTFTGPQSFLWLPWMTGSSSGGMSMGLHFRTWNKEGLLLTFDLPERAGVVWLYLSKARLCLQIHKPGSALNDGQWHNVELISRRGHVTVAVDGDEGATAHTSPSLVITKESNLFYGCPADVTSHECTNPFRAFQGCMRSITINNQPIDLIMVQQRLLGNYSQLQIDMCGIIDRCSPSHCEHGGRCSQSWSTFHCNCSDTGYSGATCHSSIHEQSCEAYKHKGNTSGYYYIDVDGSRHTQEKTWMVIQHNNTELTRVRPSVGKNQHLAHFEYTSQDEQLMAIVSQSEHCEQEVAYHCRKSRFLNTPEGSPLSWWVGGPGVGQVQNYWGGAQPGSQQCACGFQEKCVDPKHHCNCDADRAEWTNDSGLLTQKETLPVRSLVLGDVHRPGSESAYRVGPLRCHGDKNVWNAAFFEKETSYLHFPTFHGELSADISFLFKTTSSSGVFLENLGIKDFIRIELSSSTEVLFSFDVGNGPLEVRVQTGAPLNDNRWHRVRAERNIKEASLRLDELPAATQEAPANGHIHLQLNSQLFIGGTASRQKGFQGCIRSLQLNGVTLDLEERAKITPGVQPGCPGHCSSYGSLCQNHGHCVERASSFFCDCRPSAYTGAFCDREVSASFKSGTSVHYTFKESMLNELNGSSSTRSSYLNPDMTLNAENISLSFRTTQSPALLLYISSFYREYLALLLNKHGELEVRYRLDSSKDVDVLRSKVRNLANGQLHTVTINRLVDSVSIQVTHTWLVLGRLASVGFTGCFSAVRFNSISPLKAALLHADTSPLTVTSPLVQASCGYSSGNPYAVETTHHLSGTRESPLVNAIRSDSALIGGVIAVVIFVTVSALAIVARLLYRRKWMCQNQDVKTVKPEDSPELPFSSQNNSHNGPSENQKEYFI
uniref:Contactin associated protein like 3 n=1 Tax=Sphaeramia orbicularis TaxID=375764 RepID=A0A673BZ92_9TELE